MANTLGTSGTWREIREDIRRWGFGVGRPDDIEPLLVRLREDYQPSVDRKRAETARRVAHARDRIAGLRAEGGFFRAFLNLFAIQGCERSIIQLRSDETRYVANLRATMQELGRILHSPDLAGARAELDVAARLECLSDEHTVFNDICLNATRYIAFGGAPLQSAQIDHLILAPSGVFVVETKWWSSEFVDSGDFHDPFDQIERAAYLCYDLVRRHFRKVRVRSVIACAGRLPPVPADTYVKVVRTGQIDRYISWFGHRHKDLRPGEVGRLQRFFERHARG